MSQRKDDLSPTLTVRDRVDYPYLLSQQILTFQKAILRMEYSADELREAIEALIHMIPDIWKDKKFEADMEKARIVVKKDIRPEFAGVLMSFEFCKEHGIPAFENKPGLDYYQAQQACFNLLERKGMLSRRSMIEKFGPRRGTANEPDET